MSARMDDAVYNPDLEIVIEAVPHAAETDFISA
jgi:hypothetical protein